MSESGWVGECKCTSHLVYVLALSTRMHSHSHSLVYYCYPFSTFHQPMQAKILIMKGFEVPKGMSVCVCISVCPELLSPVVHHMHFYDLR